VLSLEVFESGGEDHVQPGTAAHNLADVGPGGSGQLLDRVGPTGKRTRVTIWVDMRDLDDSIAGPVRPMIEESMANMGRLLDEDY
jgi:hypothetical protein